MARRTQSLEGTIADRDGTSTIKKGVDSWVQMGAAVHYLVSAGGGCCSPAGAGDWFNDQRAAVTAPTPLRIVQVRTHVLTASAQSACAMSSNAARHVTPSAPLCPCPTTSCPSQHRSPVCFSTSYNQAAHQAPDSHRTIASQLNNTIIGGDFVSRPLFDQPT